MLNSWSLAGGAVRKSWLAVIVPLTILGLESPGKRLSLRNCCDKMEGRRLS